MKTLVLFLTVFLSSLVAQAQNAQVSGKVSMLEAALLRGDTTLLKSLLHSNLSFGHSNGWVQSKADVISDLVSGKLRYKVMGRKDEQWTELENLVIVRYNSPVIYLLNGQEGTLDLHVMQVWTRTGEDWKLIGRQSTKIQPSGN